MAWMSSPRRGSIGLAVPPSRVSVTFTFEIQATPSSSTRARSALETMAALSAIYMIPLISILPISSTRSSGWTLIGYPGILTLIFFVMAKYPFFKMVSHPSMISTAVIFYSQDCFLSILFFVKLISSSSFIFIQFSLLPHTPA
jgi:hypothetical protein